MAQAALPDAEALGGVERLAADRLAEFDQGIADALEHPAPVQRPG